jgi:hypothetical protein
LYGIIVSPFARRLVGVDLSEGMLAHAKDKNVYDALLKAELTEYLRDHSEAFPRILWRSQWPRRGVYGSTAPEWPCGIHAAAFNWDPSQLFLLRCA